MIPLHNHSEYSTLDGWSKPSEIVARVKQMGCPCCGLTDHGVVTGHLEFDKEMRAAGLKPILGNEMYHGTKWTDFKARERDQSHLIVLAKTDEGLRNLWRLTNAASDPRKFRNVGRISNDDLERYREGLIVTSACALGLVPKGVLADDLSALNFYAETFRNDFYIELSTYPKDVPFNDPEAAQIVNTQVINEALVAVGLERGFEFVYGDDGHYSFPDQFPLHDAYLVSGTGKTKKGEPDQDIYTPSSERKMWHPEGAVCMKDEKTVREALSYLPESVVDNAIANSDKIGESCSAQLPGVERRLPVFIPGNCPWLAKRGIALDDAAKVFIELVEQGLYWRYGKDPSWEVWDRALAEMEVFLEANLEHYFLLAWDLGEFCDNHERPIERGPGRGSSAGCIVAYALGITDADPLHYGLIFERFWNAGRSVGFPDIDSDFDPKRRKEIREYLGNRWGKDHVRAIGTVGRLKPKAAIDRLRGACAVTYLEADQLKSIVEKTRDIDILGPDQIGWNPEIEPGKVYYVKEDVGEEIDKWIEAQPEARHSILRRYIWMLENVCNRVANYGIHASGIVVSPVDLSDVAPSALRGASESDRVQATMFPMDDIDKLQLVKLDVLGLRTLDTLNNWRAQIARKGVEITWSGLDLQEHPQEMWEMIDKYPAGIFQIESGWVAQYARQLKPRSIEDLSILVAINRPGPKRSGVPKSFITRRNGGTDDEFDGREVPILRDILDETYGWFLYQEQVIAFFNAMSYTLSESDVVRKILGKKQPERWDALKMGTGEWAIDSSSSDDTLVFARYDDEGAIEEQVSIKSRGYDEMAAAAGIDREMASRIWHMLIKFGAYSFNKSHAICYAILAFRTLFAKYYAPAEFYMACIRTVPPDKKSKMMPLYINEARRLNIEVLPPDIRYSQHDVDVHDDKIYFGFSNIKGVANSSQYIIDLRDSSELDISTPESLYEGLLKLNEEFLADKRVALKEGSPIAKTVRSPKQSLQQNKIKALYDAGCWDSLGERKIGLREKQAWEAELLSVILSDETAQIWSNNIEEIRECDPVLDALEEWKGDDTHYFIAGILSSVRKTHTKRTGEPMGIVTVDNEGDEIEFVVFPKQWHENKFLFRERNVGVFHVRRTERGVNFEKGQLLR